MLRILVVVVVVVGAACGRVGFDPTDDAGGDVLVSSRANRVFVTSTTHVPGAFGGLAAPDAICAARASEAGLDGTFVAWLSTETSDAKDRLAGARGWVRVDGRPVADRVEDLVTKQILHPIRTDEFGRDFGQVVGDVALTATHNDGTRNTTCNSFTRTTSFGRIGVLAQAGGAWTSRDMQSCSIPARFYCFQIDLAEPLVLVPQTGRRAFVSATLFDPITGIAGADGVCAADASAAGMTGSFRALLPPSPTMTAASRFDSGGLPWRRFDGMRIATTAQGLLDGTSDAPLDLTATGQRFEGKVITANVPTSTPQSGRTCDGWTRRGGTLDTGYSSGTGKDAYTETTIGCGTPLPVYCLED